MWEVINRKRNKRKKVNIEIEMKEWREQFMGLLGEVEERVKRGREDKGRRGGEEDIRREEIRVVLRKMKNGKTAGMDEVPSEVWRYGGGGGRN